MRQWRNSRCLLIDELSNPPAMVSETQKQSSANSSIFSMFNSVSCSKRSLAFLKSLLPFSPFRWWMFSFPHPYHSQDMEIEECSSTTSLPLPGHFSPLSPQKSQPNLSVHHQTIPILLMAALNQLISHSLSFIHWKC